MLKCPFSISKVIFSKDSPLIRVKFQWPFPGSVHLYDGSNNFISIQFISVLSLEHMCSYITSNGTAWMAGWSDCNYYGSHPLKESILWKSFTNGGGGTCFYMPYIFIGPRWTWGPIYGSRSLFVSLLPFWNLTYVTLADKDTNWLCYCLY